MSSESQPPEDNAKEVATIKEPGARLRQLREDAGIDLNAISAITLVPVNKLVALENGDLEKVGGSAYVTGYARNYARALKVDPDPIVKSFEDLLGEEEIPVADAGAFGDRIEPRKTAIGGIVWGSILLILAVLVLAAYLMMGSEPSLVSSSSDTPQGSVVPSVSSRSVDNNGSVAEESENISTRQAPLAPTADDDQDDFNTAEISEDASNEFEASDAVDGSFDEPEGTPESTISGVQTEVGVAVSQADALEPELLSEADKDDDLLILNFSGDCWVEVRDANGERKIAQLARSGDNLQLFGQAPFDIMMGNVRAVEILLNGVVVPITPRAGRNTLRVQVGSSR